MSESVGRADIFCKVKENAHGLQSPSGSGRPPRLGRRRPEKYVPAPVREYIDEGGEDTPAPAKKQKEKMKSALFLDRRMKMWLLIVDCRWLIVNCVT